MKIIGILLFSISAMFLCAAEPEQSGLRLEVTAELVGVGGVSFKTGQFTVSKHVLEVRSILKNTGSRKITVPTSSYNGQPDCFGGGGRRRSICFVVGNRMIDQTELHPSPIKFAPVDLEPGECTELPDYETKIPEEDVAMLETMDVSFRVDQLYALKKSWWFGDLEVEVKIKKAEEDKKPNQSPEPQPPSTTPAAGAPVTPDAGAAQL